MPARSPNRSPSTTWGRRTVLGAGRSAGWTLDSPETTRVKVRGYSFALLAATPGLLLILRLLIEKGAYLYAALHGTVILGAVMLFPFVILRPSRMVQAERYFAVMLVASAAGFLIMYARHPQQIIGFELLGSILLFIVAALLLVLPPRWSLSVSLVLLLVYRQEVAHLSGQDTAGLTLSQWVNTGMFALLMVGVVMRETLAQQAERVHLLQEMALRDVLTGLLNRRGFEEAVQALRVDGRGGTLMVLDIDHFKPINDTFGHVEGDRLLEELAGVLQEQADLGDALAGPGVCGRWGGEEFVLYLPQPDPRQGMLVAERVRAEVQARTALRRPVTVSVGVSAWWPDEKLRHAFLRADEAMYAAKRAGRNRVSLAPDGAALRVSAGS